MTTLNPMRTPNTVPDAERLIEQLQAYVDMEADQKRQIGDRVRELRENSRYTNETLAQAVGVSARAVGKWIEGKGISRDSAEKVAEVFDVDPDWLWSGRERVAPDLMGALSGPASGPELARQIQELQSETTELRSELSEVRIDLRAVLSLLQPDERGRGGGDS